MKCSLKITFFILLFCYSLVGFGQAVISNGSFENWSNQLPSNWATLGNINPIFKKLTTQDTLHKSHEKSAIKIKTDTFQFFGDTAIHLVSGFAYYGSINLQQTNIIYHGIPFTEKPDSFAFAFRYASLDSDTGFVGFWLTKNGNYLGGIGDNIAITNHDWDSLKLPIVYTDTLNPDTIHIILRSSGSNPKIGSCLWIDNLYIKKEKTTGINEISLLNASVFPIPTSNKLIISTDESGTKKISITDLYGKFLLEQKSIENRIEIDVSQLAIGTYFINIASNNKRCVKNWIKE